MQQCARGGRRFEIYGEIEGERTIEKECTQEILENIDVGLDQPVEWFVKCGVRDINDGEANIYSRMKREEREIKIQINVPEYTNCYMEIKQFERFRVSLCIYEFQVSIWKKITADAQKSIDF